MTAANRRPKQPDDVRARLLAAGVDLLADGVTLSIGEVATLAGVTKGAVQHHFGTRQALLEAIYESLLEDFTDALGPEDAKRSSAERYVQAAASGSTLEIADTRRWGALLVACIVERSLSGRWAEWVRQDRRGDGPQSVDQSVARLAADGLWLSDILGIYDFSGAERQDVARAIHRLAQRSDP